LPYAKQINKKFPFAYYSVKNLHTSSAEAFDECSLFDWFKPTRNKIEMAMAILNQYETAN
jgi:hypothetical protein